MASIKLFQIGILAEELKFLIQDLRFVMELFIMYDIFAKSHGNITNAHVSVVRKDPLK